jgi:DNA gyrase subunit A
LCNPTQGIAVGLATDIPSFNFHEVIKATIELIKKGKIKQPLMPDFTTGGYYVKNKVEEEALTENGQSKLKLRGSWHIEGKTIVVDEIPYYTTVEKIMKKIDKIDEIVDIKDESDRKGLRLTIECNKKNIVDDVLKEVLRISPLQMDINTNITIIINGEPKVIGITDVLREWVAFRKEVVERQLNKELKDLIYEIEKYDILVDLMTTIKKREKYFEVLLYDGEEEVIDLLFKFYPKATPEIFDWILSKTMKSLANIGDRQKKHLLKLKEQKKGVEEKLLDINGTIVKQLKELNKKYDFPRKTKITDEEFDLKDNALLEEEKAPEEVLVVIDGLFIKKMHKNRKNDKIDNVIECMSSDTFVFVNDQGNLLRVQVDHLDFDDERAKGTYIPNYISKDKNDFKIIDFDMVREYKKGYLHRNGYVTTLDLSEWMDLGRITTFTKNGLAAKYIKNIMGTFKQEMDYIVLRTKKDRLAIVSTDSYSEKSR